MWTAEASQHPETARIDQAEVDQVEPEVAERFNLEAEERMHVEDSGKHKPRLAIGGGRCSSTNGK